MSNIFINRNRSQGAYTTPQLHQKFKTVEQQWNYRAKITKEGNDTFYKQSMRYQKNPDLSPKHTGIGWSIVDSCDYVKPSQEQMEERWGATTSSFPLHKAYSIYEDAKQPYDKRMELYPGVGSPDLHPSMQSNGFVNYTNSGGISHKEDIRGAINSIAARIARAKEIKGTLCLNNRMANHGTYKTPPLDLALNSKQGFKGGETAQRFYTKFPIYRPKAHGMVDVTDDLNQAWKEQTSLHGPKNSMYKTFGTTEGLWNMGDTSSQFKYSQINRRSNSNMVERETESQYGRTLKLAGKNTITFPKRKRFNENSEQVIREMKTSSSNAKLNLTTKQQLDNASQISKRSLTKSELSRFFSQGKKKANDAVSERLSQMSKGSRFKNNLALKLKDREAEKKEEKAEETTMDQSPPQIPEAKNDEIQDGPEEMAYIDEGDEPENKEEQVVNRDDVSIATEAIEGLSVAPTEMLANEYKRLMDQYEEEQNKRKELEMQIQHLQMEAGQQ